MCGIVGFIGSRQAAPVLLDGLSKLEYRGYDSAGLAVRNDANEVEIVKAKGRLKELAAKTNDGQALKGCCGIGHTRWATHGEPSETNAHPHCSDDGNVVGVHNGIIENYQELKDKLVKSGYIFYSETDTEVAVKLIDYYLKKYEDGPVDALARSMTRIRGSYALVVMFKDYPEEIYVARKDSPMIIGVEKGETYVASDVPAILKYTRNVYYIGNIEIAKLDKGMVEFYNIDREPIEKELTEIHWDAEAAEKGGFEHFMMKEIHEQPKAVRDTIFPRIKEDEVFIHELRMTDEQIKDLKKVFIIACGSAYHAGVTGKYVIEELSLHFGKIREKISRSDYLEMLQELKSLPDKIEQMLQDKEKIQYLANQYIGLKDVFFLGRGIDYASALEASLKLKEISYVHSEAYAAGELKHGTISLIEDGTLVVALVTQEQLYGKIVSNIVEVKTRGAFVLAVTNEDNKDIEKNTDYVFYIPKTNKNFTGLMATIPMQLFAYYVAVAKGCDVDQPRNLAKSVTVE